MLCEVPNCLKDIDHGNLILLKLQKIDLRSGAIQDVKMFVSVCDACIKKYNYSHKVRGEIKILDTVA